VTPTWSIFLLVTWAIWKNIPHHIGHLDRVVRTLWTAIYSLTETGATLTKEHLTRVCWQWLNESLLRR
jgi:hypothetical protein